MINESSVYYMASGALLINISELMDKGLKQVNLNTEATKVFGMIFLIFGWIIVSYVVGFTGSVDIIRTPLAMLFGAGIAVSTIVNNEIKRELSKKISLASYIILLLAFGYTLGIGKPAFSMLLGMISVILIIVSNTYLLPMQREENMIDGPGMSMNVLGWILMIIGNSYEEY